MFLPFLLRLLGGAAFPLLALSAMGPGGVLRTGDDGDRETGPARRLGLTLLQLYVWMGWAAYCATLAVRYRSTAEPSSLLFEVTAFLVLLLPLVRLSGERAPMYRTAAAAGFVLFSVTPALSPLPYGWVIDPLVPTAQEVERTALTRDAARGDADAQFRLAEAYATGRLGTISEARAERWYSEAAAQDHPAAQARLCAVHLGGVEPAPEISRAVSWCTRAAAQGDAHASFLLATLYRHGRGVEPSPDTANRLYRSAAEGGVRQAQIVLGLDYVEGDHIPADPVEAYRWLTLATAGPGGERLSDVAELRDRLRRRLTIEQLATARRMVIESRPRADASLALVPAG